MCKRHAEQAGGSLLYASSKRADAMGEAEIHVWKNTAPRVVLKAVTFQSNTASTRVRVEIAGRTSSFASLPRDRGSAKLHNTGAAPPVNVWLSESKGMSVSTKTDSSLSKDAGEAIMLRMHETIQKAGADRGTPRGRVPGQMKLGSALLLYSCLAWTQAEEPESRFGLVISTLEDRSTLQSLPGSIEGLSSGSVKAKENSEKAFVQLREFTASISALETGIASLEGDVKELQDTQDQMSNIREEEASKYNEEVDLNAESARTVDKALSKIGAKSSFLQRQSLEPDSGYVMGLLRGIKEKLNQTRSELDQTEEAKRKTHSSLFKAKKDQLSLLQAEVLEKTRLLQQAKVQLVEAQRIHDEEQESGKEMIRMQAETREKCDAKDGEYKLRQDDKKKEREAIVEAVSLLKQEEAGGENAAGATFFLQMSSKHRMSEDRKDSIRDAVALMQQQTADKAQGMGKAAEAVLQLVEAIRGHQAEDTKRKQFCEFQLDGSQDTKAKLQGEVARLKARQEYLSSEVTSLTSEVEGLKKDAAKFTDRLSQLEEVRSKEQDSYKASSRDRGLTLKVVKKAKSIVEGFYKSKDLTAFSQEDASPPKMTWKLGSSRNGNLGSSVIAMLDTIMEDFQKEQKDADAAEEKAEEELAKVRSETKSLFDKKLEHVSKLLQEKARDAEELTQVKADAELKTSSLAATEDALVKLGKDCTKLMADYEKVAKERRKQILQLQDVADILSGATVGARTGLKASGTLAPAPHNPTMRALLERYTQSHTLTERDEDGEHPLFPQSRSRRAEQRPGHAGGAELVLAKESMAASSREQILISRVLHKIDTEKLTHVKEVFMEKENALTSKDFVDLLLPTVRSMEGGEEQVVAALQLVHETIGQGVKGEEEKEVKEVEEEDDLMNPAFMTEAQVEEETQKLLSWEVFAKLLLQEGVVANVVAGFNLTQVLSVIDLEKITPLQAIFEKKGNVDLESFVVIMKGQFQQVFELIALFELYEEERKIISQLVNLFDAIDVDCNGSMTWEEFTAFLVDQGMAEDVPQQYNIIRFSQSPLKDGNGHQSHCEKVIYLKGYDKVAFVEQGSRCLKLCSPDMKPYFEIRDFTQTPLCAEYIEKYNWVAVSCSDKYLSFFDVDNSLKLVRRVQSKTAQRVLCWSEAAEVLFSADHEGRILSWSLHKVKFGPFDDKTGEEKKEPTWRDFMKDAIFKRDPPMRHISVEAPREASMSSRRKGKGKKDAWGRNDDDLGMWDSDEYGDSPMHQISQELQGMDSRKKTKAKVKPRYRGENIVMQLLELPVLQQIASCGVDGNAFASLFGSSLGGSPSVMDELDRSKVEETFEVLALEVPARRTGEFLKRLAAHLLNLARRKNVEPAATSASKLILMSRSISDIGHLPTEREWLQEQITSGAVKLSTFQVTLSYEHFTAEEVLRKLLPKGMEIPSSFEQAGHIAHLNLRDSQLPYKHLIGQVILDKNKSVKTVVNKTGKIETEFRTFPMEHLAGEESTVVRLKEHQCLFEFEYQDVYWNSRLQEEHGRLIEALFLQPSRVAAETAPVVADCTCGVGPFSIPSVKLSNSLVSHANDLNPASIQWLRKSVEINKLPQVMEVDDVPPHGEDFHPPGVGSLLVIHKPRDAREFIPELFNKRHPVTHAIFNLPAAGVELLDCFRGLNYAKHGLPRPLVSCYTFSDAALDCAEDNGCVADLQRRIAKALALPEERFHYTGSSRGRLPLPSPDVRKMVDEAFSSNVPSHQVALTVRLVRNVAPTRHMFCVCFRAPLVQEEEADEAVMPSEKRPKLCEKDLLQLGVMTWDVFTGMWKRTLRGHEMGVRCMAFATSTKVLVTGGYDYNLFVWNPYVGKSIHTIHGHSAPIVGIEVLGASSNQVVSADSEGFVKTWDLGTYQMIQSFVVDEITILRAFVSIPSSKRVIAVDREFVAFDYQNTGIADQTEEEPLIKVFYNERLKVFVSGTINVVKIWDAVTGAIKVVITHKDAEITDFCFDDRGRKLFVSDHLGKIHVYHSSTGCLVKKLTSHNKEVSGMIYCQGDKNIITVSWDRSIVVHDESSKTEVVHRRATNSHKGDITCVAYSRHLGLIATGSTDCVIAVREYLKLRILSYLLGHKTDVTALAFVEPYPLLVSADFGGNVAVWAVPTITGKDHRFANKVLTRFINMQSLESSASVNCLDPICPINDDEHTFVLYTGDEDGEVRSWDLSALLPAAGVQKCPPIPASEWDPYKRVENDASHTAETVARKASSMEVPELQAQMEQPLVRQGFSWKAHSDSLRTLKVYRNPPCVVTAGFDGMAKIWTWEGKLVTVLRAYGQSTWDFPVEATDPCVPLETQNWLLEKVHEASDEKPVDAKESLTNGYQKGIQTARS
eukprot:s482_g7.t1